MRYRIEELGPEPLACRRASRTATPLTFEQIGERFGPALDVFLEESSVAFRRGLGRARAAAAVQQALHDGYTVPVDYDFTSCFAEIDHIELERRLSAYLNDDDVVRGVMNGVRAGSPTRGVLADFPLADLLMRVMLDQVADTIAGTGGRLVRVGDEFVVRYRPNRNSQA